VAVVDPVAADVPVVANPAAVVGPVAADVPAVMAVLVVASPEAASPPEADVAKTSPSCLWPGTDLVQTR